MPQVSNEEEVKLSPEEQSQVESMTEDATGHVAKLSETGYQINPDGTVGRPGDTWDKE